MLELATIGGARALGIADQVGSLRVGKRADMITVDRQAPNLLPTLVQPFATLIPNLVYSSTGYEVSDVIIDGILVVHNGQLVKDLGDFYTQVNQRASEILDVAEQDWRLAGSQMVTYKNQGFL
jgi:5-methylthioadenosine/S-adenosylhomocysteine deaminase